jgi:hypothetical protein
MVYSGQWTGCSAIRYSVYSRKAKKKRIFTNCPCSAPHTLDRLLERRCSTRSAFPCRLRRKRSRFRVQRFQAC